MKMPQTTGQMLLNYFPNRETIKETGIDNLKRQNISDAFLLVQDCTLVKPAILKENVPDYIDRITSFG